MLYIDVPNVEMYDESKNEFIDIKGGRLQLQHSLVAISKWESKWNKSFLDTKEKTKVEILDYVRCMTVTQNVNPDLYAYIPNSIINEISEYIESPMTATTFKNIKGKGGREVITSELIYYWMIAHNIPFECQKWHLNRLLTLIRVCNIKNEKPKKMSKKDIMSRNRSLNAARKQKLQTKG